MTRSSLQIKGSPQQGASYAVKLRQNHLAVINVCEHQSIAEKSAAFIKAQSPPE
jgi:hypothetical protein